MILVRGRRERRNFLSGRDPPSTHPVGPMAGLALSLRVGQTLMCRENDAAPQSPEPARDVILGGPLAGLEKIFSVSSTSTRRPGLSVAPKVEEGRLIAQPSRLLHVVGDDDNGEFPPGSAIRSSMASVEIGSNDEQGSSISRTSGCTAIARAMHSLCC